MENNVTKAEAYRLLKKQTKNLVLEYEKQEIPIFICTYNGEKYEYMGLLPGEFDIDPESDKFKEFLKLMALDEKNQTTLIAESLSSNDTFLDNDE